MPRYRRHFQTGDTVFLTLVTAQRRRWLAPDRAKAQLLNALRETKRQRPFRHLAHVLLDDHLHWLLQTVSGESVSSLVARFKLTVFHHRKTLGWDCQSLWQPRYYDHIIRDDQDLHRHLDYIHYNPVRHGYAAIARQWRWSSFHAWVARGHYTPCWGTREPDGPEEAGEP